MDRNEALMDFPLDLNGSIVPEKGCRRISRLLRAGLP